MLNKKRMGILLATLLTIAIVGCNKTNDGGKNNPVNQSNKPQVSEQQTDETSQGYKETFTMSGVRGLDWLDQTHILVSAPNKTMKELVIEGQKMYPKNLYLLDMNSKEMKALDPESYNQGFAKYSPDKKNIFYKKNIEEDAFGMILDTAKGSSTEIHVRNGMSMLLHLNDGSWVDNQTIIFSTYNGKVRTADLKGNVKDLFKAKGNNLSNTVKIGNQIYYTTSDGQLLVFDETSKKTNLLKEKVLWLIPSPDHKQFAMVCRTGETTMKLFVTDLQGKELASFTEATQIFGTGWSPDGRKLAYTAAGENKSNSGLFVADTGSGKTNQVSAEVQLASDPLSWSPDGKDVMVSFAKQKNNQYEMETHIFNVR